MQSRDTATRLHGYMAEGAPPTFAQCCQAAFAHLAEPLLSRPAAAEPIVTDSIAGVIAQPTTLSTSSSSAACATTHAPAPSLDLGTEYQWAGGQEGGDGSEGEALWVYVPAHLKTRRRYVSSSSRRQADGKALRVKPLNFPSFKLALPLRDLLAEQQNRQRSRY